MTSKNDFPLWKQHFYSKWNKFYFSLKKEETSPLIKQQLNDLNKSSQDPILFAGFIKSGNTWLRFLIYNYLNVLYNGVSETLSYSELNKIQNDALGDPIKFCGPAKGHPYLIRTHHHYNQSLSVFEKGLYIYRNPLDTLVSAYYFHKTRENPDFGNPNKKELLSSIDNFVVYNLSFWEVHIKSYLMQSRFFSLSYESLQTDPSDQLKKVLAYLNCEIDNNAILKSIDLSNFNNIQKMGRTKNEQYGNGGSNFKGEFARKGQVGSYKDELLQSTIKSAQPIMNRYGF